MNTIDMQERWDKAHEVAELVLAHPELNCALPEGNYDHIYFLALNLEVGSHEYPELLDKDWAVSQTNEFFYCTGNPNVDKPANAYLSAAITAVTLFQGTFNWSKK